MPSSTMDPPFSRAKTILVISIVMGCFAVLWPKIFFPMLSASIGSRPGNNEGHMKPERPLVHPAFREKEQANRMVGPMPRRTIEREAKPGPMPGHRPPIGGAGFVQPSAPKGSGTMGIIMPMYTIAIVCFFIYTILKLFMRKPPPEECATKPVIKDFGLDPEHRKYVFADEYTATSDRSLREELNRQDREAGIRRRPSYGKHKFSNDRKKLDASSFGDVKKNSSETLSHSTPTSWEEKLLSKFDRIEEVIPAQSIQVVEEENQKSLDDKKACLEETQPTSSPLAADEDKTVVKRSLEDHTENEKKVTDEITPTIKVDPGISEAKKVTSRAQPHHVPGRSWEENLLARFDDVDETVAVEKAASKEQVVPLGASEKEAIEEAVTVQSPEKEAVRIKESQMLPPEQQTKSSIPNRKTGGTWEEMLLAKFDGNEIIAVPVEKKPCVQPLPSVVPTRSERFENMTIEERLLAKFDDNIEMIGASPPENPPNFSTSGGVKNKERVQENTSTEVKPKAVSWEEHLLSKFGDDPVINTSSTLPAPDSDTGKRRSPSPSPGVSWEEHLLSKFANDSPQQLPSKRHANAPEAPAIISKAVHTSAVENRTQEKISPGLSWEEHLLSKFKDDPPINRNTTQPTLMGPSSPSNVSAKSSVGASWEDHLLSKFGEDGEAIPQRPPRKKTSMKSSDASKHQQKQQSGPPTKDWEDLLDKFDRAESAETIDSNFSKPNITSSEQPSATTNSHMGSYKQQSDALSSRCALTASEHVMEEDKGKLESNFKGEDICNSEKKSGEHGDVEIDLLRKRLAETEAAMERIVAQLGSVTEQLSPKKMAQVLKAQGTGVSKEQEAAEAEDRKKKKGKREGDGGDKGVKFSLPTSSEDDEFMDDMDEDEDAGLEAQEIARPPTPPRHVTKKPKQVSKKKPGSPVLSSGSVLMVYAKELSASILSQSAAAAARSSSRSSPIACGSIPADVVSVLGMEESVALESGGRWNTSHPSYRASSPISNRYGSPPRAPTPPEDVPSIYLEGPMIGDASQFVVSDSMVELEGGDALSDEDFESMSVPVVLSGKVTLSVISSTGVGDNETTEAPSSLSLKEDYAQAESAENQSSQTHRSSRDKRERRLRMAKQQDVAMESNRSSREAEEEDQTHFITANEDEDGGDADTAGDISKMEGLEDGKQLGDDDELLPPDNQKEP